MATAENHKKNLDTVVIRFAGDSGDGIQLLGSQFANVMALHGNEVRTHADFPAEIRAPAGTQPGVSGFQVNFSNQSIYTPGDDCDVLIAMNPAALTSSLINLKPNALIIINTNNFQAKDLQKAKLDSNPLENSSLHGFQKISIPLNDLTLNAIDKYDLSRRAALRCKNFFALGITLWLYDRTIEYTENWLNQKFPDGEIKQANLLALKSGYNYALTTELFKSQINIPSSKQSKGLYKQINGNEAFALALPALAEIYDRRVVLSGYPITPASTVLHNANKYRSKKLSIFQAEDEIAAMSATVGAAYAGALALTTTSGPGLDLKMEALGLGIMCELPMVVINIQRAGPSTGMPTKPEQSDLFLARFGRHGEAPCPILAPNSPSECFESLIEAFGIAIQYSTPVIILSDANLAVSTEAFKIPDLTNYKKINNNNWIIPGTKDKEFRLGGLEKDLKSGNVSYDPQNHQDQILRRENKIKNIAKNYQKLNLLGKSSGDILITTWGSCYGSVLTAVKAQQKNNKKISLVTLTHLYPFHKDLEKIIKNFKKIICVELNQGQLAYTLRAEYLVDVISINKIQGVPFKIAEIMEACDDLDA